MIGFVLIVVLVIVGLMIFLVLQTRSPKDMVKSGKLSSLLSSLEKYTTECEKNDYYLDLSGLIVACYRGKDCSNLGIGSCEYLESELDSLFESVMKTESIYSGYVFNITVTGEDNEGLAILYGKKEGNCSGLSEGAMEQIALSGGENINLILKMYQERT